MPDPGELATWQRLAAPAAQALRDAAMDTDPSSVAAVSRLRELAEPALVHAALQLAIARRKARAKWPREIADRLVADPAGVEMASSWRVALHKADRFAAGGEGGGPVLDLCCGIGGDAMALRARGVEVIGIDADPARAWMCGLNAQCPTVVQDVREIDRLPAGRAFHVDPARRNEAAPANSVARRVFRLEDLAPAPETWRAIVERFMPGVAARGDERVGGAIKLGPGVNVEEIAAALPRVWGGECEVEYISECGRMVQAVVWLGGLARAGDGERIAVRATALTDAGVETMDGEPGDAPTLHDGVTPNRAGWFLFEPDPSVERARLLGALCARHELMVLHHGLGLLIGQTPITTPWARAFRLLHEDQWNEKRIAAWLRAHDAGVVEVKTRGGSADAERLQSALRGGGSTDYVVFVLRLGSDRRAFVCVRAQPM
jgi:hypothetical protein